MNSQPAFSTICASMLGPGHGFSIRVTFSHLYCLDRRYCLPFDFTYACLVLLSRSGAPQYAHLRKPCKLNSDTSWILRVERFIAASKSIFTRCHCSVAINGAVMFSGY